MTTITNIAQRILDENNYTTSDCSLVNTEYLVKKAVEHVNLKIGSTISFTPSGGTQSLTATDAQLTCIQNLSGLLLRAYLDKGPNTGIAGVNISSITTDPHYSLTLRLIEDQIAELKVQTRQPPIYVTNDPVPTSE
jgi:hypothetical protein